MHQHNMWRSTLAQWLPLAIVIIIFSGLAYVTVQQNYRMGANDPQIQIAQDITTAIVQGTPADSIVPTNPTVDVAASLSPFVAIFDDTGKPVGASVSLDGKLPTLPDGIFAYAKQHGQDNFTWQPKKDVRIAAVVTHYSGKESGFVLAGRSLTEIEKRESQLLIMSAIAGAVALVLTFLVTLLLAKITGHPHSHKEQSAAAEGEPKEASHHP